MTRAPCDSNSRTTATCPLPAARCSDVQCILSWLCTWAPRDSKSLTVASELCAHGRESAGRHVRAKGLVLSTHACMRVGSGRMNVCSTRKVTAGTCDASWKRKRDGRLQLPTRRHTRTAGGCSRICCTRLPKRPSPPALLQLQTVTKIGGVTSLPRSSSWGLIHSHDSRWAGVI